MLIFVKHYYEKDNVLQFSIKNFVKYATYSICKAECILHGAVQGNILTVLRAYCWHIIIVINGGDNFSQSG